VRSDPCGTIAPAEAEIQRMRPEHIIVVEFILSSSGPTNLETTFSQMQQVVTGVVDLICKRAGPTCMP
jgi:hypothetical protein